MKRIEIKLNLEAVAPLLDRIKESVGALEGKLAAPVRPPDSDAEMEAAWAGELLRDQKGDCQRFLAMFDQRFFADGTISLDEENAGPVLRACAAIRLNLRESAFGMVPDEALEGGKVSLEQMDQATQNAFEAYVFLATLQELIIENLDGEILS